MQSLLVPGSSGFLLLVAALPAAAAHLTPLVNQCNSGDQPACAELYDRASYECDAEGNAMSCDIKQQMDALSGPQPQAPAIDMDELEAAENACVAGDIGGCETVQSVMRQLCDDGIARGCELASQLDAAIAARMAAGSWQRGEAAPEPPAGGWGNPLGGPLLSEEEMCRLYPDRCSIFRQDRPEFSPYDAIPAGRGAIDNALNGLPPGVRSGLYPPGVAEAVRNGTVDRMIEDRLHNGFDPLAGTINGRGPGGAGYTNDAAQDVWDGALTPECAAIRAMGGRC